MNYVALLRGINIGGRNKIDMKQLVSSMEKDGFKSVSTYINSGNLFFSDESSDEQELSRRINTVIKNAFSLDIKVLIRDQNNINLVAKTLPEDWANDKVMKTDILYLWDEIAGQDILNNLSIKPKIDNVLYVERSIIWNVNRENATKSGLHKLAGTYEYSHMTIRNCNTVRRLAKIMNEMP